MIFVDANIFMYAAGADHSNKQSSVDLLLAIAAGRVPAASSVEVLQEVLHRYRAINRWAEGARLFDRIRIILDTIVDVTLADVDMARLLLERDATISARDCLHVATAVRIEAAAICS